MKLNPYTKQVSYGGNSYDLRGGSTPQTQQNAQAGMAGASQQSSSSGTISGGSNNAATWNDPRDANQQAARTLGYTGVFGTGGIDAWRRANNVTDAAFAQAGGNKNLGISNPNATTNQNPYATQPGTTWSDPRDANQQAARNLGYTGVFGSGGIDAWRRATNVSDQAFARAGGNKVLGINEAPQNTSYDQLYQGLANLFNSYWGDPLMNLPSSVQNPSIPTLTRPDAMELPSQLSALQGLSDQQQLSSIATDALYGAGADNQARDYFLNLLQRNVMNDQGQAQGFEDQLPIVRNYLQQLGLPIGSTQEFLQGLARYRANPAAYA